MSRGILLPFVSAVMAAAALFALAGYQVTTERAGTRLLGRVGGALVEVDRWLPEHQEDVNLMARDRPQGAVRVTELPVPVTLSAAQVLGTDSGGLRAVILEAMGKALYEEGNDAFRDDRGARNSPGVDEPVYWTVLFLHDSMHSFWRAVLPVCALVLLAVCAALLLSGRGSLAPLVTGAGFAAAASLAVWFAARAIGVSSAAPLDKEIALIVRDGAWIGLRNALAVLAAGLLLMVVFRTAASMRPRSYSTPASSELRRF